MIDHRRRLGCPRGSANERPGITGIAHLFEHMMFKGTPHRYKELQKDLQIIAEQEKLRDEMRQRRPRCGRVAPR